MEWEFIKQIIEYAMDNGVALVMCILLYVKVNDQDKQHHDDLVSFQQALENNTIALTKLNDSLEK